MIEGIKSLNCLTRTVKKTNFRENKKEVSFGQNDTEITKALAEASKSNFVATNATKQSATVGQRMTRNDIPSDWHLYTDGPFVGFVNGGINEYSTYDPSGSTCSAYEKNKTIDNYFDNPENVDKFIDVYNCSYVFESMYSYPTGRRMLKDGAVYVENDGSLTYYKVEDVAPFIYNKRCSGNRISIPEMFEYNNSFSGTDIVVLGLLKDGRTRDANRIFENFDTHHPVVKNIQENYLISKDKVDDFDDKYFTSDEIYNIYSSKNIDIPREQKAIDFLAKGDLKGAVENDYDNLPYPLNEQSTTTLLEIDAYIKDNNLLEKWAQKHKEEKASQVKGVLDDDPDKRFFLGIATLGISEAINKITKEYVRLGVIKSTNGEIRRKHELTNLVLLHMLLAKEKVSSEKRTYSKKVFDVENSKEPAKTLLQQRLLDQIKGYKHNKNVDVPNCVMLTSDNPYMVKDIMDWIEENSQTFANCTIIPAKKDKAQMQEDILNALETAEENYQQTNDRTIIFVNGMQKLLNPDLNESEDIAVMKDLMDKASRYFHSTIVFYAKDPKTLDPGTMVSHRVGLKVKLPNFVE